VEGVTLAVALLASGAILVAPPRYALPFFLGAIAWYPSYLAVSIGTVYFTVGRIVILAVLGKLLVGGDRTGGVRWGWVDTFVVTALVGECIAGVMTTPAGELLQNRAGAAFDTLLPYFAVRLGVRTKEDYKALLWSILVIAVPLAIFGAYECWTGDNPLGFLRQYSFTGASLVDRVLPSRGGFWRAEVTFPMSIMFGLFFAMLGPICAGLWGYTRRQGLLIAGLGLMVVGVLSSRSSGPIFAGMVAVGAVALFPFRRHWKVALVLLVLWLTAIEIASNRHWYEVLASYGTLDAETAYYRIGLIREAFGGGMSGHWLLGLGNIGFDELTQYGWEHADITNQYILILVRYGLLGVLPFIGVVFAGGQRLRQALKKAECEADRWLVWCLLASFVGIVAGMFSVSLFGQTQTIFFVMLGLCGAVAEVGFFLPVAVGAQALPPGKRTGGVPVLLGKGLRE
jgi:hypothetical protein